MSSGQDLMRRVAIAGARMDPKLSNRDVDRLVTGARLRRRARRGRRVGYAGALACALVVAFFMTARRTPTALPHADLAPGRDLGLSAAPIVHLSDGSTAVALDPTTEISVSEDSDERVTLELTRGRGRFDVKPRPSRTFIVHVGDVTLSVLGTLFTVERVADRVGVSVESGTVRVDWGVGATLLKENDSGWYPPLVIRGPDSNATTSASSQDKTTRPASGRAAKGSTSAPPARDGSAAMAEVRTESAEDLLRAADDARIAGRAEQGAELLRRLLRERRSDARAPLAAFTLGRMLLMELGRPLDAAGAFAEARRLSPEGPFAEDALAREVEALSKSGAPALAQARAQEYLNLYPAGRRAASVRALGGIR